MLLFCPRCCNMLVLSADDHAFKCETCPYRQMLETTIARRTVNLHRKAVEDVMGEAQGGQTTSEPCPKCSSKENFFTTMQTRSADEPETIFYRCGNKACRHTWKEG